MKVLKIEDYLHYVLILSGLALACWYLDPIREYLANYLSYNHLCWILTSIHFGGVILVGLWIHDLPFTFSVLYAWEYGFLFLVAGNTQIDLYPLSSFVLLEGIPARIFAFVTGHLAYNFAREIAWGNELLEKISL